MAVGYPGIFSRAFKLKPGVGGEVKNKYTKLDGHNYPNIFKTKVDLLASARWLKKIK